MQLAIPQHWKSSILLASLGRSGGHLLRNAGHLAKCGADCEDPAVTDNYLYLCSNGTECCPASNFVDLAINVGTLPTLPKVISLSDFTCTGMIWENASGATNNTSLVHTNVELEISFNVSFGYFATFTADLAFNTPAATTVSNFTFLQANWATDFCSGGSYLTGIWTQYLYGILDPTAGQYGFLDTNNSCTIATGDAYFASLTSLPAC